MEAKRYTRKDIGDIGERVTCAYLQKVGMRIVGRNIAAKTGELDVIAEMNGCLHIIEVKTISCTEFPSKVSLKDYNPAENLHHYKIRKVVRTAQWYVAHSKWEGEWQVDAALVWIRKNDGMARICFFPQIL